MINFTEPERRFIKRAMVAAKNDLNIDTLNLAKQADMLIIIKHFRAKGYMASRRTDNGKDFNTYYDILAKLGKPKKHGNLKVIEDATRTAEGIMIRLNEAHDSRIGNLEEKLEVAKKERDEAINKIQDGIKEEIASMEAAKQEALQRLEIAKSAQFRLEKAHEYERKLKQKKDEKDKGAVKCWECGDIFKSNAGLASHQRAKHPELVV